MILTRRALIVGGTALLAGCDGFAESEAGRAALFSAENFHRWSQRALTDRKALAREFAVDEISPIFRANGTRYPNSPFYLDHSSDFFARWRVAVTGLVDRPLSLSMTDIRSLPAREQITRHDCVEGWSAIGKWRGARLAPILQAARLKSSARYLVFHCADHYGGGRTYYESIDLIDAFHPQTILAYALNDKPLLVANGAPVRMRIERQLGYKHAKYVTGIEAVADLEHIHGGKGGFWEDVAGYEWYAGI